MHTEQNARKKVCPHLPVDHEIAVIGERNELQERRVLWFARCIASDCMAWHWHTIRPGYIPGSDSSDTGYCGLADKGQP